METMGFGAYQPLFLVYLGEAYVLADRLEDARRSAPGALDLARERGQRAYEAWALRLLGEITAHARPSERDADGHYRERARARRASSACAPSSPTATSASASSTGARAAREAAEHLTTATTMYREMDMRFWLEQAEAV